MPNPFEKRVTEYLRDDEAFLAVVSPEPLTTFFLKRAQEGSLFDRLTMIIGTPGSGKTTLARLFQFTSLRTLLRNRSMTNYKPLIDSLTGCGAIDNERPTLIGCRLPLETEYREFWEFPYTDELKSSLMIGLLQARTVLAWLRNFESSDVPLDHVEIVPRPDAAGALTAIGGKCGLGLLNRARQVELAIYRVAAALVPPRVEDIDQDAVAAYRPYDVIEAFRITDAETVLQLQPLVIFDDAHVLHPIQFLALRRSLARRELKVSRWILTRLDALKPSDVLLYGTSKDGDSGLKPSRETTIIPMQSGENRLKHRRLFRKMAVDMAERYLNQMDVFNRRGLHRLADLLSTQSVIISPGKRKRLTDQVEALQRRCGASADRLREIENQIDKYLNKSKDKGDDLRLAIFSVLLERYAKRIPQRSLFEEVSDDADPRRALTVDASVADGARIHLLHNYERPYFFGIDALCDASSENAEQFLQLAARLVSQSETQLIRSKDAMLASGVQHKLLRERATEMIDEWDFPHFQQVRRLTDGIAVECLKKSLEGNASLGGGASAFGIPQEEFDAIPSLYPELAQILQFAVAYNTLILSPRHRTKNRYWCLIELGGILLLHYGLTLKRGGFLERDTSDLLRLLKHG